LVFVSSLRLPPSASCRVAELYAVSAFSLQPLGWLAG